MIKIKDVMINPAYVVKTVKFFEDWVIKLCIHTTLWREYISYTDVGERQDHCDMIEKEIDNYLLQKQNATIHEGSVPQ